MKKNFRYFKNKNIRIIFSLVLCCVLGMAIFYIFTLPKQTKANPGWLTGWSYRKPITINNTSNANTLSNYQILVTVDTAALYTAGKVKSDCSDIRFTDSDETTLLNYWIEDGSCNTTATKFWVKIPTITGSTSKTIYMYYGNASATRVSSGANTFDFFDDFEAGNLDSWTKSGSIIPSAQNSVTDPTGSALAGTYSAYTRGTYPGVVSCTEHDYDGVMYKDFSLSAGSYRLTFINRSSIGSTGYDKNRISLINVTDSSTIKEWSTSGCGNGTLVTGTSVSYGSLTTYTQDFTLGATKTIRYYARSHNGGWQATMLIDNIYVRKYTSPEPTTSLGSEQQPSITLTYRKPITINNTSNTNTLTNYQVLVTVDTASLISAGKLQSDCDDIRFTDNSTSYNIADWTNNYPYWIESGCNTSATKIWVKVDTIPASSNKTIYMYYGNASASGASDGNSTFDFFDDFSTDTSGNYVIVGAGTKAYDATNQVLKQTDTTSNQHWIICSVDTLPNSYVFQADIKITTDPSGRKHAGLATDFSTSAVTGYRLTHLDAIFLVSKWSSGTESAIGSGSFADGGLSPTSGWLTYRVYRDRTSGLLKLEVTNGATTVSGTFTDSTYTTGHLGFHSYGADEWIDNIRVRKYTSPEPTTTVGSEQQPSITFSYRKPITINNTSNTNTLTNYQVLVTVDTASLISAGKLQSNCNDIRFTDNSTSYNTGDWTNNYPYWIESGCNTSATKIWVKVDTIPASSNKTIYMYYGNASASGASSVADTFIRVIDGVQGSWHLDEGSGTTAYDTSGNGNNGTLINGPTWIDGKFGKALSSDGSDDYVDCGVADWFNSLSNVTISLWVKPGSTQLQYADILSAHTYGYTLEQDSTNNNLFYLSYWNGSTWQGANIKTQLTAGGWQHFVVEKDGTTIRHFVNGIKTAEGSVSGDPVYSSGLKLMISRWSTGGGRYFNGLIDELCIYNRALTAEEISDLYNYYGYTTTNYPGKVLVRKYSSPEPTTTFNNAPVISSVTDMPDPINAGIGISFNVNWTDPDPGDLVKIHICKTDAISGQTCTGGSWCDTTAFSNKSPASCVYTPTNDDVGVKNYYAFVCDDDNACSTSTSGTFTVNLPGSPNKIKLSNSTASGTIISAIFDTGVVGGAAFHSLLWQGTLNNGVVKFQLACSNSKTGPWTYYGPTSVADYYQPAGPNIPVPIANTGDASCQNKRYIRYKMFIEPSADNVSPEVDDVIINWSP